MGGGGEGSMEQPLGNLSELWKSPRGTVIRIEVLALVAIALSFFFVAFGSSRRWSNRWIFQKGVLIANALSLSLGTYSIGLMQSSPVKSEMYPIWAVCLLTLFGSVDSITGYSLDHNNQFLKLLYQLCLYCGYVMLIGISIISSDMGKIAIGVLCAITFFKGFHRSLASVLPSRLRNVNKLIADYMRDNFPSTHYSREVVMRDYPQYVVDWPLDKAEAVTLGKRNKLLEGNEVITMDKIWNCSLSSLGSNASSHQDVCLSYSLCHLLQRRFFGFTCAESGDKETERFVNKGLLVRRHDRTIGYDRAFKVIEVELAFLYDIFFTNNDFLHYYESEVATIWAFASIIGIIFVGVVTVIPGTRRTHTSGGTIVVATTSYDLIITLVILASIALLQLMQLIRCWTSNWARVALVCQSIRNGGGGYRMRLKAFLCGINWFDGYLWQRKLGQHSFVESISTRECGLSKQVKRPFTVCTSFVRIFGLRYIEQVYEEMFGGPRGSTVVLAKDVKELIVVTYMGICANKGSAPYFPVGGMSDKDDELKEILRLHIATCYLEMKLSREKNWLDKHRVEEEREKLVAYVDVATTLSKYYAYLMVSAPELLPWNPMETKFVYNAAARDARRSLRGAKDKYEAMRHLNLAAARAAAAEEDDEEIEEGEEVISVFLEGVDLGTSAEKEPVFVLWKELAEFWATRLIDAALSDNAKEHIHHLSRGGEFITHVWALLFHAGQVKEPSEDL